MIQSTIKDVYYCIKEDPNHRFRSWEHCYSFFGKMLEIDEPMEKEDSRLDHTALHLAFYLASWGMYRGSSKLLQKDYRVHIPIIQILLEPAYNPLRGFDPSCAETEEIIQLILELSNRLKKEFAKEDAITEKGKQPINASETLITKILLGTLGCVPAFDRFFCDGMKAEKLKAPSMSPNGLAAVTQYYLKQKPEFDEASESLSSKVPYPPMKLVDMYFWQMGYLYDQNPPSPKP